MSSVADPGSEPPPRFSPGYRRLVLSLLVAAYTFNFIDRTIVASIGQAIKVDLKISDTQLGLLGGLYFALLYTILGVPLARFAERFSRVNIIAGAIVVWSGFTALCGATGSFAALAACRFGVGVGEAGLSPSAQSLISDYYEPRKRASALSIYAFGIPLGTLFGASVGGWLAQTFSWRVAFFAIGAPGLLVALAIRLLIREPPRGHSEPPPVRLQAEPTLDEAPSDEAPATTTLMPTPSLGHELRETWRVTALLFGRWPIFNIMMGITMVSFAGYGGGQFVQPYFLRTFHLNYAQVGLFTGLVGAGSQGVGTLLGGFITDRLAKSGAAAWYALVPAIGVTLSYPFIFAIYTAPTWPAAIFWLAFPGIFGSVYLGPTYGVIQNAFPASRRATATAVLFLVLNLIGLGGGPPFVGWMIDHFAAFHHAHPGQPGVWAAVKGLSGADARGFQTLCPGGLGRAGGSAGADAACKTAVRVATRQGVLLAYAFGLWGALHYLLAAFGLKRALARARLERGELS